MDPLYLFRVAPYRLRWFGLQEEDLAEGFVVARDANEAEAIYAVERGTPRDRIAALRLDAEPLPRTARRWGPHALTYRELFSLRLHEGPPESAGAEAAMDRRAAWRLRGRWLRCGRFPRVIASFGAWSAVAAAGLLLLLLYALD